MLFSPPLARQQPVNKPTSNENAQPATCNLQHTLMKITSSSIDVPSIWRCQPDPFDEGERLGWDQADIDITKWRETRIPGTFETAMPDIEGYIGTVWFRTLFNAPDSAKGHRVEIHFGACNNSATVYLNGHRIGSHKDAYSPFLVDATRAIRSGANQLAVRVSNDFEPGALPGHPGGWRSYGGILRPVGISVKPRVRLGGISACGQADGRLPLLGHLLNDTPEAQPAVLRLEMRDQHDATVHTGSWNWNVPPGELPFSVEALIHGITPWSPSLPVCYKVIATLDSALGMDSIDFQTGFRTFEVDGTKLKLNGEPLILRGFNRHEDSPDRQAAADPDMARRDIETIKSAGANFVRLAHYPHDPSTLDICDELGLLSMAEIPLYWWHGQAAGEKFYTSSRAAAGRMLRALIARDRHHPSVIAWSVGNENAEERPEVVEALSELLQIARTLDADRAAVHVAHHWDQHAHFDHDDIICLNAYPSYEGRCAVSDPDYEPAQATDWWRRNLDRLHRRYPDKPILITEYGHPAWKGTHGYGIGEDTQQSALLAETEAFDISFVCGYAIWCFADHPWPFAPYLKHNVISSYGLWTRQRIPKQAASIVSQLFAKPTLPAATNLRNSNLPIFMIRPDFQDLTPANFPEGFRLRALRAGEEGLWEDIHRDAEPFFKIPPGLFMQEFGEDLPATRYRCLLVVGPRECAVGTISAWYTRNHYGKDTGRIHWLAIRPAFQGRGLAKAALFEALRIMAQWHQQAWLATSTRRFAAIRLYLHAGFQPDLRPAGAHDIWRRYRDQNPHPSLTELE